MRPALVQQPAARCWRVSLLALVLAGMSACQSHAAWQLNGEPVSTATETREAAPERETRAGFNGIQLGDERTDVLARLADSNASAMQQERCSTQKLAMRNSRRAFILESCELESIGQVLHGMQVTRIGVHLIDDVLVRIDADLIGEEAGFSELVVAITERYGTPDSDDAQPALVRGKVIDELSQATAPDASVSSANSKSDAGSGDRHLLLRGRWRQAEDVVDLREQQGDHGLHATLYLIDALVADRLTALWPD